jgi:signal transduction histidine kinase/ActR/RegA family two-component response regulator
VKPIGLGTRILLAMSAVLAGLLVFTYLVVHGLVDRFLDGEIRNSLGRARQAHASFCGVREAVLLEQARSVAQVPHLRAVLDMAEVDRQTIQFTLATLKEAVKASLLVVADADGRILADTEPREDPDPSLSVLPPGSGSCGIREYAGRAYLMATVPVTLDSAVLGVLGLGYPLQRHVEDLHEVIGLDAAVLRGNERVAAAWEDPLREENAFAAAPHEPALPWSEVSAHQDCRVVAAGREFMATSLPIQPEPYRLVLSRPLDSFLRHFRRAKAELLVIGLLLAGLGLLVSRWLANRIADPIRDLTSAAKKLALGDLSAEVRVSTEDEIGLLGRAFNDMARQLQASVQETLEKARAAEQASQAKSVFLATMSHEIRTPLNGVLGFAEQLLSSDLTSEQRDQLLVVQRSGQDLLAIIDEILDFARIEAGGAQLEDAEFKLAACLRRALDPLRPAIGRKKLEFEVEVESDVPDTLIGPSNRLRQVLANYASNAVKFTRRGSIHVRVQRTGGSDSQVVLRFEVRDTGIGIPGDQLERLFKPFAQIDCGSSREFGGTGLGLAISKELVAAMGGEVGVESELNRGSTFWFTVRLRLPEPSATTPSPRPALPSPPGAPRPAPSAAGPDSQASERRGRQRILVAEDNAVNRKVTGVVLSKAGWTLVYAENGREAVSLACEERFDLVLMDCQMPAMDGLEATREIRRNERETGRYVPIIALTANAFETDRKACLASGMDDFLAKPVSAAELIATIERWLA